MAKSNKEVEKGANWTFLVYPDSAPKNWIDILQETGCELAISPLHEFDIDDEESGELKKPHWHVILVYPNTTTFNTIKKIVDKVNAPIPKLLNSVKGMWRYFTHMDHPHKYQYKVDDIRYLNGFDVDKYNPMSLTQKYKIKKEIFQYIKNNNINYYVELLEKLMFENEDWFNIALDNTLLFNSLIKSVKERQKDKEQKEALDKKVEYMEALKQGKVCDSFEPF